MLLLVNTILAHLFLPTTSTESIRKEKQLRHTQTKFSPVFSRPVFQNASLKELPARQSKAYPPHTGTREREAGVLQFPYGPTGSLPYIW